jgi:UDP-glucuronate 4-epimerase
MRVVVTGCAGFIGSHLAEAVLRDGHTLIGIDSVTDYYETDLKRESVKRLSEHSGFTFAEADMCTADLVELLDGAEVVYHQAGQPGVRLSWSDQFPDYVSRNVIATQRLLEAAKLTRPRRIVFASSSSVYGNAPHYPTTEQALPQPHSPYGVTKLAAEHLCGLYAANWGVPTVALRYFTVYGPRQRPDMGLNKFIDAAQRQAPLPLFGDGEQIRDFTYVSDVVDANLAAATADVAPGTVVNIAGGRPVTVNQLLRLLRDAVGSELRIEHLPEQAGDIRRTGGAVDLAHQLLGWSPQVDVADGVAAQYAWQSARFRPSDC